MGQQQLFLILFLVAAVGAATIFAVMSFEDARADSDREAALGEAVEIALLVQTWKATTFHEGGGAERTGFFGIDFAKIGLPHTPFSTREMRTDTGCYQLETRGDHYDAVLTVTPLTCSGTPFATAEITGPYPEDVVWNFDW